MFRHRHTGFNAIGRNISLSFGSSTSSNTNASSYTFSSMTANAAASDRLLVAVLMVWDDGAGSPVISSPTIGGISASIAVSANSSDRSRVICYAYVPTGTTANVATGALGVTCERAAAALYSIYGARNSVPFATATTAAGSSTINCNGRSAIISHSQRNDTTAMSWTVLTENSDINVESSRRFGSASLLTVAGTASFAFTSTGEGNNVTAAWV